jgi:hypothetical protein
MKTGDIILQRRSGIVGSFVSFFTKSEFVHCGIYLGDNIVHVDAWGKHFTDPKEWTDVVVVTPTFYGKPLTEVQLAQVRFYAIAEPVWGYDFLSAVRSWIWKNPNDDKPTGKFYHCSEFVSKIYHYIGIDLVPTKSDDSTQPQDFLNL